MQAVLWQIEKEGPPKEISHCNGVGEIYWPYIRLEASELPWTGQFTPSRVPTTLSCIQIIMSDIFFLTKIMN